MDAREQQLYDANWNRMRIAITRAASRYRDLADELEQVKFDNHAGRRRSPESIIGQVAHTLQSPIAADLIGQLALWAETINEITQHAANHEMCGYTIDDPVTSCVLAKGHQLPYDDGMVVHVNEHGGTFL